MFVRLKMDECGRNTKNNKLKKKKKKEEEESRRRSRSWSKLREWKV